MISEIKKRRWKTARTVVQIAVIMLIASPLFGASFFHGNLAGGALFGVSLSDPLAFLQATAASRIFIPSFLLAAMIIAALYFFTGGRSFCGWVCPVYLFTEIGESVRRRIGSGERSFPLAWTRWTLAVVLAVSLLAGVPLFEIISPIGITTRAIMFKAWLPLVVVVAIIAVELFAARRIWCRSLCPVGGFYSLLGRFSPVRIRFERERCTCCGDCEKICHFEEVLEYPLRKGGSQVVSGDCTRCGDCIDICPARALRFGTGYR